MDFDIEYSKDGGTRTCLELLIFLSNLLQDYQTSLDNLSNHLKEIQEGTPPLILNPQILTRKISAQP